MRAAAGFVAVSLLRRMDGRRRLYRFSNRIRIRIIRILLVFVVKVCRTCLECEPPPAVWLRRMDGRRRLYRFSTVFAFVPFVPYSYS